MLHVVLLAWFHRVVQSGAAKVFQTIFKICMGLRVLCIHRIIIVGPTYVGAINFFQSYLCSFVY